MPELVDDLTRNCCKYQCSSVVVNDCSRSAAGIASYSAIFLSTRARFSGVHSARCCSRCVAVMASKSRKNAKGGWTIGAAAGGVDAVAAEGADGGWAGIENGTQMHRERASNK